MHLRGTRDPAPGEGVLVELVESDDSGAATDGSNAPPVRRRRRPLWWAGAAVLLVLVVVATVANVAEARRAADRRAALAALPWITPALDGPLEEVWRSPGTSVVAVMPGVMVLQDGVTSMSGVDPATGAELWTYRLEMGEYCGAIATPWPYSLLDLGLGDGVGAASVDRLLLCQQTAETTTDASEAAVVESEVQVTRLHTLDARTGEGLAEVSAEGWLVAIGLTHDGGDLVMASQTTDDAVVVERVSLRTGQARWRYASDPGGFEGVFGHEIRLDVGETSVAMGAAPGLVLSLDTGEVLPAPEPAADAPPVLRREFTDGSELQWWYSRAGSTDGFGQVVDADGTVRFTFEGYYSAAGASDRAPGSVLVRTYGADWSSTSLTALDLTTGDELWSRSGDEATEPVLELDGTALMISDTAMLVDERTGRTRWEHPTEPEVAIQLPVTDGHVVVLPVQDNGLVLVAVDLATGKERWRMTAPEGASSLTSAGSGLVLVTTTTEVIAYRP